ncbi:MAG: hypothetical protein U5J98_10470 [Halobacteriales archaeon]|nr:hypothetical protein [Halobacteriales archaeon]
MTEAADPHPLDGAAVLVAGAKASVPLERLPSLLEAAQARLAPRKAAYERRYECVHADGGTRTFLAEPGHWRELGVELGFTEREADAAARAHAEQVRRLGRELGRAEEFETALEIREAVVVA